MPLERKIPDQNNANDINDGVEEEKEPEGRDFLESIAQRIEYQQRQGRVDENSDEIPNTGDMGSEPGKNFQVIGI
jgi:hypothetical protein